MVNELIKKIYDIVVKCGRNKTSKREKLYSLIQNYMLGEYDTQTYSDKFADIYLNEPEDGSIRENEAVLFREVGDIAQKVCCYIDVVSSHPGRYFTECDIRKKTIEVCKKLNIDY